MADSKKNKVIFVCTGNICRSPMGEGLLKHAINATDKSSPLRDLEICSAGLSAFNGSPASRNSIEVLKNVGVDISNHKATLFSQQLVDEAFAIFAMDSSHMDLMQYYFKNLPQRTFKVLDMVENSEYKDVADPYGGDIEEYTQIRDDIVSAIAPILKYLENETKI